MKTLKIFPYSESELLRTAVRFDQKLQQHRSKIEDYEPELNDQFVQQFKNALERSITYPQDKNFDQQTIRLHAEMELLIEELKHYVANIKFYFQKAFPHDPRMWEQYGYCEFDETSHNYFKIQHCLAQLFEAIEQNRVVLKRVQFPFGSITDVERLKQNIGEKNDEIIDYYEESEQVDEERIEKLNELYRLMQIIDNAVRKYRVQHKGALKKLILPKLHDHS